MSQHAGLNRRSFLRSAGMTALVGAVGPRATLTGAASAAFDAPNGKYDFDTPYNRMGTDSVKWDQAMRQNGMDSITAGMGIADMDFKCAPSITKALVDRIQHENWGYLDMPKTFVEGIVAWNKKRYGLNVDPESVVITTGVHPGLIAAIKTFCPVGSKVLLTTPTYTYIVLVFIGTVAVAVRSTPPHQGIYRWSVQSLFFDRAMGRTFPPAAA